MKTAENGQQILICTDLSKFLIKFLSQKAVKCKLVET